MSCELERPNEHPKINSDSYQLAVRAYAEGIMQPEEEREAHPARFEVLKWFHQFLEFVLNVEQFIC
jgi:hypothetical protein